MQFGDGYCSIFAGLSLMALQSAFQLLSDDRKQVMVS
jgi:hypothetical protein